MLIKVDEVFNRYCFKPENIKQAAYYNNMLSYY